MSTTLHRMRLKTYRILGLKSIKSRSVFGKPYVIFIGDFFSENPFFDKTVNVKEILCCVAWCKNINNPVIFDIGAHCGYMSSHFAQLLIENHPVVTAFEPVYPTFKSLNYTIERLKLEKLITPVHIALTDIDELVSLNYSKWNSMFAQIFKEKNNQRSGDEIFWSGAIRFDSVIERLQKNPDLIKIDVEGYESKVFKGASKLLSSEKLPAICLEWNPIALCECNSTMNELASILKDFDFYYINDYENKSIKFLEIIDNPVSINWVCNLFAIPKSSGKIDSWKMNIELLVNKYKLSL